MHIERPNRRVVIEVAKRLSSKVIGDNRMFNLLLLTAVSLMAQIQLPPPKKPDNESLELHMHGTVAIGGGESGAQ